MRKDSKTNLYYCDACRWPIQYSRVHFVLTEPDPKAVLCVGCYVPAEHRLAGLHRKYFPSCREPNHDLLSHETKCFARDPAGYMQEVQNYKPPRAVGSVEELIWLLDNSADREANNADV